jgi:D-serine dehydratase
MTPLDKGIGAPGAGASPQGPAPAWRLLAEEVGLPAAVLREERLNHNLRWMQSFAEAHGVLLAPHGKTSMAPGLFRRQIDAGAWGITVATAQQAMVAFHHGVRRVLMANLLVGRRNLEIVHESLAAGAGEFYCLVDSVEAVAHLGRFFRERRRSVDVLLELGPAGGRTGARDAGQEASILAALEDWGDAVRLAGVEVYEGVLDTEEDIRQFLRRAVATAQAFGSKGRFRGTRPILSGAGSAWYDVVAEEFAPARESFDVLLRPGCYATHDVGAYRKAQDRIERSSAVARRLGEGLQPALQLWAYVLSVPEPGRAILGLGKRDAAFDSGFPEPSLRFRPGKDVAPRVTPPAWKITKMMDQHAYLGIAAEDDVQVGDILAFDICHPCLTFDKWRRVLLVDRDYRVVEVLETCF